jgi:hypothetical protein
MQRAFARPREDAVAQSRLAIRPEMPPASRKLGARMLGAPRHAEAGR